MVLESGMINDMWSYNVDSPTANSCIGYWRDSSQFPEIDPNQIGYYKALVKYYRILNPRYFETHDIEGRPISEIIYNLKKLKN